MQLLLEVSVGHDGLLDALEVDGEVVLFLVDALGRVSRLIGQRDGGLCAGTPARVELSTLQLDKQAVSVHVSLTQFI